MQVSFRVALVFSSAVLFLAALSTASFAQLSALGLTRTPAATATAEEPPEAPQPQFEVAAVVQPGQQAPVWPGTSTSVPQSGMGTDGQGLAEQQPAESTPKTQSISGTVIDVNGDIIPGADVVIEGPMSADRRTTVASDNAAFEIDNLKPGIPYRVTVSAKGFLNWKSSEIVLKPGQYDFLTDVRLQVAGEATSVTVLASNEQIAIQQVQVEEEQRILGLIPNFYVVYDKNPVPLPAKLKFKLALRVSVDPISFLGAGFLAGIDQAANTPDYVQGAKGYGERLGSVYADGFTDVMFGGAILPALLRQDPRYYFQGTGTISSRALHAVSSPFICKGDNGKWQPNYSSIGGDVISASLSNLYYPASNRGLQMTFENVLISTAERTASSLIQEFVLRKLTPKAKNQH